MRLLLALLALFALTLSPLAGPAEASVTAEHCTDMAGMDHGQPDKGSMAKTKSCCVAAVATLDGYPLVAEPLMPSAQLRARELTSLPGMRGEVEVPPPRI